MVMIDKTVKCYKCGRKVIISLPDWLLTSPEDVEEIDCPTCDETIRIYKYS